MKTYLIHIGNSFDAEEADVLDLLSGKKPDLSSERFRRSGFLTNTEAASEEFNSGIGFGIIYQQGSDGDYNLIGIKPLDEK